jgi:hypothetical protein
MRGVQEKVQGKTQCKLLIVHVALRITPAPNCVPKAPHQNVTSRAPNVGSYYRSTGESLGNRNRLVYPLPHRTIMILPWDVPQQDECFGFWLSNGLPMSGPIAIATLGFLYGAYGHESPISRNTQCSAPGSTLSSVAHEHALLEVPLYRVLEHAREFSTILKHDGELVIVEER